MTTILLKDLKKGEFFTLKPTEEPNDTQVYVKEYYCREDKKYYCHKYSDVNYQRAFNGNKQVYIDFTF